jgi:hypothetical protein
MTDTQLFCLVFGLPLMAILASVVVGVIQVNKIDGRIANLEAAVYTRINSMEPAITTRITSLEWAFNTQFTGLQTRFDTLIGKVIEMEGQLQAEGRPEQRMGVAAGGRR